MSLSTNNQERLDRFAKASEAADLNAEQYLTGETAEIRQSPFEKIKQAVRQALGL